MVFTQASATESKHTFKINKEYFDVIITLGSVLTVRGYTLRVVALHMAKTARIVYLISFSSYPFPTRWGRYNMFSSCCDKDSEFIFTTRRLPDVNPP
jgi:hypothetical protein